MIGSPMKLNRDQVDGVAEKVAYFTLQGAA
jgi:hypothetical protein